MLGRVQFCFFFYVWKIESARRIKPIAFVFKRYIRHVSLIMGLVAYIVAPKQSSYTFRIVFLEELKMLQVSGCFCTFFRCSYLFDTLPTIHIQFVDILIYV